MSMSKLDGCVPSMERNRGEKHLLKWDDGSAYDGREMRNFLRGVPRGQRA